MEAFANSLLFPLLAFCSIGKSTPATSRLERTVRLLSLANSRLRDVVPCSCFVSYPEQDPPHPKAPPMPALPPPPPQTYDGEGSMSCIGFVVSYCSKRIPPIFWKAQASLDT